MRNSRVIYQKLILTIHTDRRAASVQFHMDTDRSFKLEYTYSRNGHWVKNLATKKKTFKNNCCFVNAIIDQSLKVFKASRKTFLREFRLNFEDCHLQVERYQAIKQNVVNRLQVVLGSLDHRISVEKFRMHFDGTQEEWMKILPYLEAGTLKKSSFGLFCARLMLLELPTMASPLLPLRVAYLSCALHTVFLFLFVFFKHYG